MNLNRKYEYIFKTCLKKSFDDFNIPFMSIILSNILKKYFQVFYKEFFSLLVCIPSNSGEKNIVLNDYNRIDVFWMLSNKTVSSSLSHLLKIRTKIYFFRIFRLSTRSKDELSTQYF